MKFSTKQATSFSFQSASMKKTMKELSNLDTSRATLKSDIPTKLINENSDIFSEFLYENFNNIVENENFPIELKWADVNRYIKKIIELNLKVKMNFRPDIRQMFFSEKNHDIKSYYTL